MKVSKILYQNNINLTVLICFSPFTRTSSQTGNISLYLLITIILVQIDSPDNYHQLLSGTFGLHNVVRFCNRLIFLIKFC